MTNSNNEVSHVTAKLQDGTMRKKLMLQKVKNEVQRTLLIHAPERWHDEDLDRVEAKVIASAAGWIAELTPDEISSERAVSHLMDLATAETMDLITESRAAFWKCSW
jgi:hypothetical protein